MQERCAGHRDEICKRIGSRHRAPGEDADRAGLTLGVSALEDIVDDVSELLTATKTFRGDTRQEHPSPRRLAKPSIPRDGDDVTGEPRVVTVEDRATLEPERDVGAGAFERSEERRVGKECRSRWGAGQ